MKSNRAQHYWKLFISTGSVDAYLLYKKELENQASPDKDHS
ncbi:MAG: YqzL family protein [Clostridia bacterium]|nr:YqzL family protein [Clostridia bacterium]